MWKKIKKNYIDYIKLWKTASKINMLHEFTFFIQVHSFIKPRQVASSNQRKWIRNGDKLVLRRRQRLRLIASATHGVDFILHCRVFITRALDAAAAADCWENITSKFVRRCSVCHQVRAEITHRWRALHAWIFTADELPNYCAPSQNAERNFFGVLLRSQQDDARWPAFWSEKPQPQHQTHIIFGDAWLLNVTRVHKSDGRKWRVVNFHAGTEIKV